MKGKFLLKVNGQYYGYSYLPAWGWSVRAWQQIGSVWLLIGATAANADGTWDLNFIAPPFPGFKVRIEYQPANRFVQVQDSNANVYTWGNSLDYTAPLTDVGTRNADLTNNGDAPGIDRIYQASSALWRRFNADGMNPVRDNPIEITFPNSSTDPCPQVDANNMPIPWSCSDSNNGKIWLIPKHAKAGVVQHELAHSIHSYYWDGNMPSGGGIQHKLNKCYNDGLALTEGFANFVAYWVQFERDNPGPVEASLNYNIEKPPSNFCKASSNEGRVSAAFWDAYDTHDDGVAPISDSWNIFHHGAAVGTFLNNPGHNSMKEYWPVYISILGGNSFLTVFDSFSLNWILP